MWRDTKGNWWLVEVGTVPARETKAIVSAEDTEAILQDQVSKKHPEIPEWYELMKMGAFDSTFFGDRRTFLFLGQEMAGWEVNYYFIAMALAHQGYSWGGHPSHHTDLELFAESLPQRGRKNDGRHV